MESEGTALRLLWQGGDEFVDGAGHGFRVAMEIESGRAVRVAGERSGLRFEGIRMSAAPVEATR